VSDRYRFQDENTGWWICEECSAIVSARSQHDAWHDRVVTGAMLMRLNQALQTR
jgi:hypothetical protein